VSTAGKLSVAALIVVAAVVGIAIWWFAGSTEEAVDQDNAEELASQLADTTEGPAVPVAETQEPVTNLNGTWSVTAQNADAVSDGSFAGYRIHEILSGLENEVTGRTSQVTGEITIEGDQLTAGSFEVDMASITTDQGQRDNQMRDRGYQHAEFPTSTFVVTEPVAIDADAALGGEAQQVAVVGELTLHGVTREVTLELTASIVGSTLAVTGSVDIALADHDIDKPTGMRVADVDDVGVMEIQLFFAKAQ
jgi:polyisoprenoid-binding protein YceI